MIERYTIKVGPAVSQKELKKILNENIDPATLHHLHKMKARIEVIVDFEDLKRLSDVLKQLQQS